MNLQRRFSPKALLLASVSVLMLSPVFAQASDKFSLSSPDITKGERLPISLC